MRRILPTYVALTIALATVAGAPAAECPRVNARQILQHEYNYKRVRVQGALEDAFRDEIDSNYVFGLLFADGIPLYAAFHYRTLDEIKSLIGAQLLLTGYVDVFAPPEGSRRISGPRLLVNGGADAIVTVTPPPADPFDAPELISAKEWNAHELRGRGHSRVTGTVLARWGKSDALIATDSDGRRVRITFRDETDAMPVAGDRIDAVGMPEYDYFRMSLVRADWRPSLVASGTNAVRETEISLVEATNLARDPTLYHYGTLIRFRGRVLDVPRAAETATSLLVESNGQRVRVNVSAHPKLADLRLAPGCTIEVRGRIIQEVTISNSAVPFAHVSGYFIVPERADGIRILSRPSWFTARRLLIAVLALLVILASALVWNRQLGRVAERRGRELFRRRLEGARETIKTIERNRLSVELHDSIAQALAGVAMELEAAEHFAEGADGRLIKHFSIAMRILDSCRQELKNCLWDLRNDTFGERNLGEAIRRAIVPYAREVALNIRVNIACLRLDANLTYDIVRIARELTLNAIRHGKANCVDIAGCLDAGQIMLSVSDNGCGFDPDAAPGVTEGHFGIRGIRERLRRHDGTLAYERREHGTYARVTLTAGFLSAKGGLS